jgi:hypothetical protein
MRCHISLAEEICVFPLRDGRYECGDFRVFVEDGMLYGNPPVPIKPLAVKTNIKEKTICTNSNLLGTFRWAGETTTVWLPLRDSLACWGTLLSMEDCGEVYVFYNISKELEDAWEKCSYYRGVSALIGLPLIVYPYQSLPSGVKGNVAVDGDASPLIASILPNDSEGRVSRLLSKTIAEGILSYDMLRKLGRRIRRGEYRIIVEEGRVGIIAGNIEVSSVNNEVSVRIHG